MTDKRILKTKKALKQTLMELIREKPFRKITVKEICDKANTSRITFYTYYDDKYDLLGDLVRDFEREIYERYDELQKDNNAGNDPIIRQQNIMDAIFDIQDRYMEVFNAAIKRDSFEVLSYYFRYVLTSIGRIEEEFRKELAPKYPMRPLTSFVVTGIVSYVHESDRMGMPRSETRQYVRGMIADLMKSDLYHYPVAEESGSDA